MYGVEYDCCVDIATVGILHHSCCSVEDPDAEGHFPCRLQGRQRLLLQARANLVTPCLRHDRRRRSDGSQQHCACGGLEDQHHVHASRRQVDWT